MSNYIKWFLEQYEWTDDEGETHVGMTQSEAARQMGFDFAHVNQLINERKKMTPGFQWRWFQLFGVTLDQVQEMYEQQLELERA